MAGTGFLRLLYMKMTSLASLQIMLDLSYLYGAGFEYYTKGMLIKVVSVVCYIFLLVP